MKPGRLSIVHVCLFAALATPMPALANNACLTTAARIKAALQGSVLNPATAKKMRTLKAWDRAQLSPEFTLDQRTQLSNQLADAGNLPLEVRQDLYLAQVQSVITGLKNSRAQGELQPRDVQQWSLGYLVNHADLAVGRRDIQLALIAGIRGFSDLEIRTQLENALFQIAARAGFSEGTALFIDGLPSSEKLKFLKACERNIYLPCTGAMEAWEPYVRLQNFIENLTPMLDAYYTSGSTAQFGALFDPRGFEGNLALGSAYSDVASAGRAQSQDAMIKDLAKFSNGLSEVVYRLIEARLKYGVQNPASLNGHMHTPEFAARAVQALMVIMSRVAREGGGDKTLGEVLRRGFTDPLVREFVEEQGGAIGVNSEALFSGNTKVDPLKKVNDSIAYQFGIVP